MIDICLFTSYIYIVSKKGVKKSHVDACFPDLGCVLPLPMRFLTVFLNLTMCFSWTSCIVHEILFGHLASAILCFQFEESLRHRLGNQSLEWTIEIQNCCKLVTSNIKPLVGTSCALRYMEEKVAPRWLRIISQE